VPFEALHRNERDAAVAGATAGREPCVVAQTDDDRVVMLLDAAALEDARTVAGLADAISAALDREGLVWPTATARS